MTIKINLLPWRAARKEEQKRLFGMASLASAGCSVGIVLLIHGWVSGMITWQSNQNSILKQEIQMFDQQLLEIEGLQQERDLLLARMNIIQQLQSNRPLSVKLFDTLVRIVPKGLYLTDLQRLDNQIVIEGRAESNTRVSKLMRNIEATEILKNPILTVIQLKDEKVQQKKEVNDLPGYTHFHLSALIVGGVTEEPATTPTPEQPHGT